MQQFAARSMNREKRAPGGAARAQGGPENQDRDAREPRGNQNGSRRGGAGAQGGDGQAIILATILPFRATKIVCPSYPAAMWTQEPAAQTESGQSYVADRRRRSPCVAIDQYNVFCPSLLE